MIRPLSLFCFPLLLFFLFIPALIYQTSRGIYSDFSNLHASIIETEKISIERVVLKPSRKINATKSSLVLLPAAAIQEYDKSSDTKGTKKLSVKEKKENDTRDEDQMNVDDSMMNVEQQQQHIKDILSLRDTIVLHVGKAGGGTLMDRFKKWKLRPQKWCHPSPCHETWVGHGGDNNYRLHEKLQTVIITIRDPVDRFNSAFNWRALVVCQSTDIETRIRANWIKNNPGDYCKDLPIEHKLLHEEYHNNANELAEALCDTGAIGKKAREDILVLGHLNHFLTDWIPQNDTTSFRKKRLVAMVQEPGFDYVTQIDAGLKFAVNQSKHGNEEMALHRYQLMVQRRQQGAQQQTMKQLHHSTRDFSNNNAHNNGDSSNNSNKQISALGTCCVARYLQQDYELLQKLETTVCWGDEAATCRDALQSIQKRREVYFRDTNMSCQDIVREEEMIK